jgi:hypothetical protein
LAPVRETAVRELARFLRGSDAGMAKAARAAAEQARDDDSRRVSTAAAEVLAAAFPVRVEPVPSLKPASKPQPAPAPTNNEDRHSPATPIFSPRSSKPHDVVSSLRESDSGAVEAARKATEAARDDDSRRVAKAKAEILGAAFPAGRETIPLQGSALQPQPAPVPKSDEKTTAAAPMPSGWASQQALRSSRRDPLIWGLWIIMVGIAITVIFAFAIAR